MIEAAPMPDSGGDVWIHLSSDNNVKIGAYLPGGTEHSPEILTVFWHGNVTTYIFRSIIDEAEYLYGARDEYECRIFSYGNDEAETGPIRSGVSKFISPEFDAYRVEFRGDIGDVILWANVKKTEMIEASDAHENIGICVNKALYDSNARELILSSICRTNDYSRRVVASLLEELSKTIHNHK